MTIDYSELRFPKPTKKQKKSGFKKSLKERIKPEPEKWSNEIDVMIAFYEANKNDMASVENYRFTKKLRDMVSRWIDMVIHSQKCEIEEVLLAWQSTVLHAAEKAHSSHKAGGFMNMFWIIKNDSNFLDILEGKYDREFKKRQKSTAGWGDKDDFAGVSDPNATII